MKFRTLTLFAGLLLAALVPAAWAGGSVGVYVGVPGPYWAPAYPRPYYPRPYYYPGPYWYPAPVYAPPVVVVPPEPTVYVEQGSAAASPAEPVAGYWYFCREANNYYTYVKECPGGWQQVAPQPAN